jgi:threonine dehydrogenase-like Zn-dependent dehydrogenase
MQAIVLNDHVEVRSDYPTPNPADGEVLVRVLRAGICETDLQLIKGYMGFRGVLGHEFVGVAQSGPMTGRRVVGEINCACWQCETCRTGLNTHCPNRTVLGILGHDGAFASMIAVPQRNLHLVPDSLSDDEAVFAEPVAAACQIAAQITVRPEDRIVVLGDGRLGNLCAQVLSRLSSRVLVVGKYQEKLGLLLSMGIDAASLSDPLDERAADIVVDCTGSETGLSTALKLVRPRGTIVLKTTVAGAQTMAWAPFVIDEVTLVGSRCGPFDQALLALERGHVKVQPLISDRFPLGRGIDALARAQTNPVLKVLLDVS